MEGYHPITYTDWCALSPEEQEAHTELQCDFDGEPFVCECGNCLDTSYGDCGRCESPLCSSCQDIGLCFLCLQAIRREAEQDGAS